MQSLTFPFVLLFGTNEVAFLSGLSLLEAFKLVQVKDSSSREGFSLYSHKSFNNLLTHICTPLFSWQLQPRRHSLLPRLLGGFSQYLARGKKEVPKTMHSWPQQPCLRESSSEPEASPLANAEETPMPPIPIFSPPNHRRNLMTIQSKLLVLHQKTP
jgi:hypothetical protein